MVVVSGQSSVREQKWMCSRFLRPLTIPQTLSRELHESTADDLLLLEYLVPTIFTQSSLL